MHRHIGRFAIITVYLVFFLSFLCAHIEGGRPVLPFFDSLTEQDLTLLRLSDANVTTFALPDSHLNFDTWDLHCTKTELACAAESSSSAEFRNCSYTASGGCNLLVLGLEEAIDLPDTRQYNLTVSVLRSGSEYFFCFDGRVSCAYATGRQAIRYYYSGCDGSLDHCIRLQPAT
jgi:hypothetical protein